MKSTKKVRKLLYGFGKSSNDLWGIFFDNNNDLNENEFWEAFRYCLIGCERIAPYQQEIEELLQEEFQEFSGEADELRKKTMYKKEMRLYDSLPEKVTVYRGMTEKEFASKNFGISWTLDNKIAEFFAFKFHRRQYSNAKNIVHKMEVDKKDIYMILLDRNEKEVILNSQCWKDDEYWAILKKELDEEKKLTTNHKKTVSFER